MYNIQKKIMIQSRENLVTDRQTDRRMSVISWDANDFMGCCPTNIEPSNRKRSSDKIERERSSETLPSKIIWHFDSQSFKAIPAHVRAVLA